MTQRIGTGANAQITTYAVTTSTTPRLVESGQPVGAKTPDNLTVQSVSPTASRVLDTGPVNPGRFYVQGATLVNTDAAIVVYVSQFSNGNATTSIPIQPGAALRLDVNALSQTYLFAASGTPVVKVIGV